MYIESKKSASCKEDIWIEFVERMKYWLDYDDLEEVGLTFDDFENPTIGQADIFNELASKRLEQCKNLEFELSENN